MPAKVKHKWFRFISFGFLSVLIFFLLFVFSIDQYVKKSTVHDLYDSINKIPKNKVGLLLGTSKYLSAGEINLYYKYRIEAAIKLFKAGKIQFILVSGDNAHRNYDEPQTMREDLIAGGIPKAKIYLDFAGFRTLDSVVRAKEIFGQDSLTIISQKFHNERAIFLARDKGIVAWGYDAKDVDQYYGFRTKLREKLARAKMILDILVNKQPKFLGEKIDIH